MLKSIMQSSLVLMFLLTVSTSINAPPQPSYAAQPPEALAVLEPLQGVIQYLPRGDQFSEWKTITEPTFVGEGDQIRTGAQGWALLTFFEGVSSEIFANTQVYVTALELPEAESSTFNISYDLLVGDTFNSIDAILDNSSKFEVRTPTITASVRGTEYFAMASPTGQSMFVTREGELHLLREWLPESLPFRVESGQSMVVSRDGSSSELYETLIVPAYNLSSELAPETCGDFTCQPGEENVCDLDCGLFNENTTCGDSICERDSGESLLNCELDCGSVLSNMLAYRGSQSFAYEIEPDTSEDAQIPGPDTSEVEPIPLPEVPDRFDFGEATACLQDGSCDQFCEQNPEACQQFSEKNFLNCTDVQDECSALDDRIQQILAEKVPIDLENIQNLRDGLLDELDENMAPLDGFLPSEGNRLPGINEGGSKQDSSSQTGNQTEDTTDSVENTVEDTTDSVENTVGDTTDSVESTVEDTTDSVESTVNDVKNSTNNLLGGDD